MNNLNDVPLNDVTNDLNDVTTRASTVPHTSSEHYYSPSRAQPLATLTIVPCLQRRSSHELSRRSPSHSPRTGLPLQISVGVGAVESESEHASEHASENVRRKRGQEEEVAGHRA